MQSYTATPLTGSLSQLLTYTNILGISLYRTSVNGIEIKHINLNQELSQTAETRQSKDGSRFVQWFELWHMVEAEGKILVLTEIIVE